MIAAARPNMSDTESREMEELRAEYGDISALKSDDYGCTNSIPPYRYGRGPTYPPTLVEASSNKKDGGGRDARGHATT
jgi:hypothetical protein